MSRNEQSPTGCQRLGSKISETKFSCAIRILSYFAASPSKQRAKPRPHPSFPTQVPKHRREVKHPRARPAPPHENRLIPASAARTGSVPRALRVPPLNTETALTVLG